eukprot:gene7847-8485_t
MSQQQQEQYLQNLRQQIQAQTIQEIMNKMGEKCFKICAGKKGNSLDSSETTCVVNCMDRYMDTMHVVNAAVANRANH